MNWRVVFSIVQKDLVDAIKNYYLLFTMIMPIGLSLVFQLVIPTTEEMGQVKILLYAPEPSRYSEMLRAHTGLEILTVTSESEITAKLAADRLISGGVAIPLGFDAAFEAGQTPGAPKPPVKVYVNPKATGIQQSVFRSIVTDQAWLLVRQEFPIEILWDGQPAQAIADSSNGQNQMDAPINMEQYIGIMMLITGLAMVGAFVVPSLMVEEKEKHTLEALLVSPGGPADVAAGKALVGMVYSLLVSAVLLAMNNGFSGQWPITLLALTLGALFVVGAGLWMGVAFKVMHQVNIVSSVIMLVLITPSWLGIFGLPAIAETLMRFIPTHYLAILLGASQAGSATLAKAGPGLAALTLSVLIVYAGVIWMLRRERK